MNDRITIKDHETLLEISFADLEKYHGQHAIAGAAFAFKALQAEATLKEGILPPPIWPTPNPGSPSQSVRKVKTAVSGVSV